MSRFTLALQLTLDSGLPITKGLALSLEATGNMHFASRAGGIVQSLKGGNTLYESLKASQLFDYEFLEMVANSEEVGSVPEMMRRLTNQYQEETSRNMKMLTRGAGAAIAVCVAVFIIFAIVRLFNVYLNALQLKF
jgi:type II secretory pathway component PulF